MPQAFAQTFYLVLTVVAAAALAGLAWHRGLSSRRVSLAELSPQDRQRLLQEALTESPAVFQAAWFEPRLGYTLRPKGRIAAWGDTFVANSIGYRAHPPEKRPRTFRVLFLGDSWTYGMGIKERESFPRQFERIAEERRPLGSTRVEAWTLALPGYNTLNELAALEFFFDRLRPDVVVLCPTPNDIDSSNAVTSQGMLARTRERLDDFGDPHSFRFLLPMVDSPSFYRRWKAAFARVARTEETLLERKTPFFVFFTATWPDALAHGLVAESGLEAPYAITPAEITVGRWRNPPPFRHGTSEANRRYSRLVYALISRSLGWPVLDGDEGEIEARRIFREPPPSSPAARDEAARQATRELPVSFEPGPGAAPQCLAAMDCVTGLAPRATTFLVRRRPGTSKLAITLGGLPEPTWLYPLPVEAVVSDDRESLHFDLLFDGRDRKEARFEVRSPSGSSAAIEVTLVAARASAARSELVGQAFYVRKIEQR